MITRALALLGLLPAFLVSAAGLAQPVITVQDYGAAPREELRYRFAAGTTTESTMTMAMQMSMGGVQAPGMAIPAMRVPVTIRTTEVLADGSARYQFEMGEVGLVEGDGTAAFAQMLGPALAEIGGFTGWGWVDSRGTMLDGGFDQPAGANGDMMQMLSAIQNQIQQLSAPFPAEALGVGARWQAVTTLQMAGASMSQTMEYTLMARDGDRVELAITVQQGAVAPGPGTTAEAQAALAGTEASGSGKMTVDLDRFVAASEMTVNSSVSMAMPGSTGSAGMTMNMQTTMTMAPD